MREESTKKLNILFLSHKLPYPAHRGDRIPAHYRIQWLSKRHRISLACPLFTQEDRELAGEAKKTCITVDTAFIDPFFSKAKSCFYIGRKPITVQYFYSPELEEKIQRRLREEKFDLIYVFSSGMAPYVDKVHGIKKIIDLADVDSHKWLQYSKLSWPPLSWIYYLEWMKLQKYEKFLATTFDHTIFITEAEKLLFKTYVPEVEPTVIPNGVNFHFFKPTEKEYDPYRITFTGVMDYQANADAALYFGKQIFPLVQREIPEAKFYVVGLNPTKAVQKLAQNKSIVVTGFVENIREYLTSSCVFAASLRIARGIQNKILEAMACGVPVVTTSRGNQGVNAKVGESIFVEDDPQSYAKRILSLMQDKSLRKKIAQNGRQFIEQNYDWDKSMSKLEELLITTCEPIEALIPKNEETKDRL